MHVYKIYFFNLYNYFKEDFINKNKRINLMHEIIRMTL